MSIVNVKKSKMGRPPSDTEPVTVRVERVTLKALDDWRRQQADLPTRPEAIRRLIELGLERCNNAAEGGSE
jgi:hypothetical protein